MTHSKSRLGRIWVVLLGLGLALVAYIAWGLIAILATALPLRMDDSGYVGIAVRNESARAASLRFTVWEQGEGQAYVSGLAVAPGETGLEGYVSRHRRIKEVEVRLLGGAEKFVSLDGKQFRDESKDGVLHLRVVDGTLLVDPAR